MKKFALLVTTFIIFLETATAQHEEHQRQDSTRQERHTDSTEAASDLIHMMIDSGQVPMSHAFSLNLPMNRNGSGTGWLPDASPMYGYIRKYLHGSQCVRSCIWQ